MKKVVLDKDHWFIRFYKFSIGLDKNDVPTQSGCIFFWNSLFSIILAPLTWWNVLWGEGGTLIGRAWTGMKSYLITIIIYVISLEAGEGLYGYGIDDPNALIRLFDLDNLIMYRDSILMAIAGLITIILCIGFMVILGASIVYCWDTASEKIKLWKRNKRIEKSIKEDGNSERIKEDEPRSPILNAFSIIGSMIKNACPVIEWK